jgi:prolyl oligopeptidase
MKNLLFLSLLFLALLSGCTGGKKEAADTEDPYLWLEDIEGEKALDWVRARNKVSDDVFRNMPLYDTLKGKFLNVFNDKDQIMYPGIVGDYVYNLRQDRENERGLWRRMPLTDYLNGSDEWELVLSLDKLSAAENKKWVLHGADWLAPDYRYCLLNLSDGGKDEGITREFDAVTKSFVTEGFYISESKGSATWVDKDNIVVATDFGPGTMTTSGYPCTARLWKRGSAIGNAVKIAQGDTTDMGLFVSGAYTEGQHKVFISSKKSFFETDLYLLNGDSNTKIECPSDAEFYGLFKNYLLFYLQSDWVTGEMKFESGSLVSFDLDSFLDGKLSVKTIYKPDLKSSFVSLLSTKEFIVVATMENVQSRLKTFRIENGEWSYSEIPVPAFGTISLTSSSDRSDGYFFEFSNPVTSTTLFYGNNLGTKVIKKQKDYFDVKDLVVEQYETKSKDGTVIPYFIVHKNDLELNGRNPTLIYGYGGFNISEQPYYNSVTGIGWLEQGGVYVIANIRGGGEFGPGWHQAAMKEKRQNAYDDFFAVSEDLIDRKITSHDYFGAYGWSNGGLLAGVAFTQRPDLYNAVVVGAPLLDMKRYSKLLAGASWMAEYGNPDIPEDWAYISKFSPYQNVFREKKYPEVLFITSTKDDRVHPGHARKMAAKMADMGHPFYYHETIEGGHGAASTNAQEADMLALIYTYLNVKLKHD